MQAGTARENLAFTLDRPELLLYVRTGSVDMMLIILNQFFFLEDFFPTHQKKCQGDF